jgi:hypothetical protein
MDDSRHGKYGMSYHEIKEVDSINYYESKIVTNGSVKEEITDRINKMEENLSALKLEALCSSKLWYPDTSSHDVRTQKTNINIFPTMRTSNLIKFYKFVRDILWK